MHESLVMFLNRVYVCECVCVWEVCQERKSSLSLFVALLKQTDQNLEPDFETIEIHTLVGELKCGTRETTHRQIHSLTYTHN